MFATFANAHDGYGSFDDLDSATVDDAQEFFERYYAAGNAMLAVAGDFDVAEATAISSGTSATCRPGRRRRCPTSTSRASTAERRDVYTDRLAPLPGVAPRWRVPDPIAASPTTCRTWCWPRCSPTATPPGWSSGSSSGTAR